MDLNYAPEHEAFRDEVRAFLATNWRAAKANSDNAREETERRFRRLATERGYLYRGVPRRYGGGEQPPDVLRAQIIAGEFQNARAPREILGIGTQMLVPTLLECGE